MSCWNLQIIARNIILFLRKRTMKWAFLKKITNLAVFNWILKGFFIEKFTGFFHSCNPDVFNSDFKIYIKILKYSIRILNYDIKYGRIQLGLRNMLVFNWDCLKSIKINVMVFKCGWIFFKLLNMMNFMTLFSIFYVFQNPTINHDILKHYT